MENTPIAICWLRRDLRLEDNHALYKALQSGLPVLIIFIFDKEIIDNLPKFDKRLIFIHENLYKIQKKLYEYGSGIKTFYGKVVEVWEEIIKKYNVKVVYTNHDYEPYAIERDYKIHQLLTKNGIYFYTFKDQVICEKNEVLKEDGKPYTVYTPYSKKWKEFVKNSGVTNYPSEHLLAKCAQNLDFYLHSLEEMGFQYTKITFPNSELSIDTLKGYTEKRDFPSEELGTSKISVHLRFGTISIRKIYQKAVNISDKFVNELIWREFYMMILYHFPYVVNRCFKSEYDTITWNQDEKLFKIWCEGKTGIPIVDAGMRELNATGYMHNRVRMIVASFLTKNLWIDWRWGEQYFAEKLLDFELASNNGSWQWVAGCGVDAAPYFRVFNPILQTQKFDPQLIYIKKWVPELETFDYPKPIVDVQLSAKKAIEYYQKFLKK